MLFICLIRYDHTPDSNNCRDWSIVIDAIVVSGSRNSICWKQRVLVFNELLHLFDWHADGKRFFNALTLVLCLSLLSSLLLSYYCCCCYFNHVQDCSELWPFSLVQFAIFNSVYCWVSCLILEFSPAAYLPMSVCFYVHFFYSNAFDFTWLVDFVV